MGIDSLNTAFRLPGFAYYFSLFTFHWSLNMPTVKVRNLKTKRLARSNCPTPCLARP